MKLGLALSGGGIRGIAHAGALKALEENPDIDYMHMCMAAEAGIKQFVKDYMKVIGSSGRYIYGEAVVKSNE